MGTRANDTYQTKCLNVVTTRLGQAVDSQLLTWCRLLAFWASAVGKELQTQTGIKDVYTQYWIDGLITHFKQLKQGDLDRSDEDIQAKLVQWTLDNQDKIYSAFLTMKGVSLRSLWKRVLDG
ncbi:hypothetical protein B0H10DRAFT_1947003 [Mycena sp. CBHHK59/15]|nr:hypothetical protein B0H10DRAFT_1947003 [Mycena sp. CBHHK59/15]